VIKADTPEKLVGHVCSALDIEADRKIPFLLEPDPKRRLEELSVLLQMENEFQGLRNDISGRVKKRMERSQKEYFLNEQLKEIHKELGSEEADPTGSQELERKLLELELDDEVRQKTMVEVKRLSRLQPMSPESGVLRTYLEWIIDLPWGKRSTDRHDIAEAARILNADHFGLDKPRNEYWISSLSGSSNPRSKVLSSASSVHREREKRHWVDPSPELWTGNLSGFLWVESVTRRKSEVIVKPTSGPFPEKSSKP
jgi:ATP-dependent Lon protease